MFSTNFHVYNDFLKRKIQNPCNNYTKDKGDLPRDQCEGLTEVYLTIISRLLLLYFFVAFHWPTVLNNSYCLSHIWHPNLLKFTAVTYEQGNMSSVAHKSQYCQGSQCIITHTVF